MADAVTPSWYPEPGIVEASRLGALMERVGVDGYEDLHRWSVDHVDEFWGAVIDELGIVFVDAPSSIRGSDDPRRPDWLPGARLNIASSCFRARDGAAAIIRRDAAGLRTLSVGQVRAEAARVANGFREAGFAPGDRVAIAMPMTVEAVAAYVGIVAAGGVVVSIADSFAAHEMAVRFGITRPVAVVTQDVARRSGRILPMYAKCAEAAPDIPCIVVDTGAGVDLRGGDLGWRQFLADDASWDPVPCTPGDHTNILFSSGTTGEPKAIPWTHTTPIKAAMDGRYHLDIHAGDVVAWPTNLGWMMGPWLIYASLVNGATIALYSDAPTERGFVEFVAEAGVTMLGVVPSIVASWREGGTLRPGDWTRISVLSSTGEASNADDYAWFMDVAGTVPVIEYCGGTEIGGGYITGTVLQPATASRFTTPALGLDLRLLDEHGRDADVGEVFLVPPSMGLSTELLNRDHDEVYYADAPEGLRRHGDRMIREPGGTYRALGRVDDTMNLGGIKVSSAEIEGAIQDVAGVAEVAAVSVPPPGGGPERLILFVVPSEGAEPDPEALRQAFQSAIRGRLNPLFKVHDVVAVESLPRTASHKVMRRVLRSEYPS